MELKQWWKDLLFKQVISADTPTINVHEAYRELNSALFLDGRENKEYEVSHLRGSLHIGYEDLNLSMIASLRKDQPIIVYCSVGLRSDRITRKLMGAGFTDVKNMYGGIFEWVNHGFEVVDINNEPTIDVHAYSRLYAPWIKRGNKIFR